jgi:hypothetical protein
MNPRLLTVCGQVTARGQCFGPELSDGSTGKRSIWIPRLTIKMEPVTSNAAAAIINGGTNRKKAARLPRNRAAQEARNGRIMAAFRSNHTAKIDYGPVDPIATATCSWSRWSVSIAASAMTFFPAAEAGGFRSL